MTVKVRRPKVKITAFVRKNLRGAAHYAADQSVRTAKDDTRKAIVAAGLGKLSMAVGDTSSLRKRRPPESSAWGAIFARGGEQSRANEALSIYSQGGVITPIGGNQWMAFANEKVIPRFIGRRQRMTPALYRRSSYVSSLGKLQFVRINSRLAKLIARNVTRSRRTGRAKAYAGRVPRGSTREREVTVFFLIKITRRGKRFDQGAIMLRNARKIPNHAADYQRKTAAGSGG